MRSNWAADALESKKAPFAPGFYRAPLFVNAGILSKYPARALRARGFYAPMIPFVIWWATNLRDVPIAPEFVSETPDQTAHSPEV